MATTVRVVDSIMGSGKTSAVLRSVMDAPRQQRFMFVTPFLKEDERVRNTCAPQRRFKSPQIVGRKLYDLKELVQHDEDIATTHALYKNFDEEVLDLLKTHRYTLIIDEALDETSTYSFNAHSFAFALQSGIIEKRENDVVYWTGKFLGGEFDALKNVCPAIVIPCGDTYNLIPILRKQIYEAFDNIIVLTYKFEAQPMSSLFKIFGFDICKYYACHDGGVYTIKPGTGYADTAAYRRLIEVHGTEKRSGHYAYGDVPLSYRCMTEQLGPEHFAEARANIYNFFRRGCNCKSSECLWTTFEAVRDKIRGRGYSNGFAPINCCGTNMYAHIHYVAYVADKYLNPYTARHLSEIGAEVDRDEYSLSCMLQFIWRSAVRNDEPIKLLVPSIRMRCLLKQWLNDPNTPVHYHKGIEEPKLITA